ncbi:DUF4268 domain-containing protein [Micromonospora sp. DT227]|uniref:DUF4268 domain-containing protein n=1 Tax=Micromonospora sp. DT227 TaxID=3393433 RepID=UPI003CEA4E6D
MSYTCRSGLSSEIFFQDPDPAVNDARFAAARAKLEPTFGNTLSYEPLQARKGCRMAEYRKGDIGNGDDWPEYMTWFIDAQTRLRTAIAEAGGHCTRSTRRTGSRLRVAEPRLAAGRGSRTRIPTRSTVNGCRRTRQ